MNTIISCLENRGSKDQPDNMKMTEEDVNQPRGTANTKDGNDQLTSTTSSDLQKLSIDGPAGSTPSMSHQRPSYTITTTTTKKVTFWSLPRKLRDVIWNEALPPADEIFPANISCTCPFEDLETHIRNRNAMPIAIGRTFPGLVYAPQVFSCQPPVLAHVCRESREQALRRYEAAYKGFDSTTDQELHSYSTTKLFLGEKGKLRWISGTVARYLCVDVAGTDLELNVYDEEDPEEHEEEAPDVQVETEEEEDGYGLPVPSQESDDELEAPPLGQNDVQEAMTPDGDDDNNAETDVEEERGTWEGYLNILEEAPLWEQDDLLVLRCLWTGTDRQPTTTTIISNFVRLALLYLLARAKDYQIMVVCSLPGGHDTIPFSCHVIRDWGVLANRAPGCTFDKRNYNPTGSTKRFVDIRDLDEVIGFVGLVRMIWCYDLSEEEQELESLLYEGELQKRLVAECLEPFETLWAEEGKDIIKSSRYGRMPKLGVVVETEQR